MTRFGAAQRKNANSSTCTVVSWRDNKEASNILSSPYCSPAWCAINDNRRIKSGNFNHLCNSRDQPSPLLLLKETSLVTPPTSCYEHEIRDREVSLSPSKTNMLPLTKVHTCLPRSEVMGCQGIRIMQNQSIFTFCVRRSTEMIFMISCLITPCLRFESGRRGKNRNI